MLPNDQAWRRLPGAPEKVEAAARVGADAGRAAAEDDRPDAGAGRGAPHRRPARPEAPRRMRWAAADANRCAYAKAAAEADLRRAGAAHADADKLPEAERLAVAFARKLTADAATVTDEEVKRLVELHGDAKVVAMVALIAHACFQDRMLLTLDPPVEPDGPPPPVAAHFPHDPQPGRPAAEADGRGPRRHAGRAEPRARRPEWRAKSFADLQAGLERQRRPAGARPHSRPGRRSMPGSGRTPGSAAGRGSSGGWSATPTSRRSRTCGSTWWTRSARSRRWTGCSARTCSGW